MTIDLFSTKSVTKAIKDLEKMKDDLQDKCERFIERLAELGEDRAIECKKNSPLGTTIVISSDINPTDMGCEAMITAIGKTYTVEGREPFYTLLAVEYGAGVHYNGSASPNPRAAKEGYGIGTYPDQVHAFEDGWYYLGTDGKYHYSHGVKATMPMYNAEMEILNKYKEIGEEIFSQLGE